LASTDLSQVSSTLSSFSPLLPPPLSPPCVQSQNSKPLLARDRRRTDVPTSHVSAPPVPPGLLPTHAAYALFTIISLSGKWKSIGVSVSGSLDGVDLRSFEKCNNENKQNSAIEERPVLASFPVKVHEHVVMRSTLEPRRRLLAFASLA
uniref:Secreted protein n=1 Tax=Mesocestoides corti TaxID=53468 RepID=A0A0R3UDC7_MESCO